MVRTGIACGPKPPLARQAKVGSFTARPERVLLLKGTSNPTIFRSAFHFGALSAQEQGALDTRPLTASPDHGGGDICFFMSTSPPKLSVLSDAQVRAARVPVSCSPIRHGGEQCGHRRALYRGGASVILEYSYRAEHEEARRLTVEPGRRGTREIL